MRLCIDQRPLNKALKRERYHLPTFEEIVPDLADAKIFTKVDFKSAYWHVELDKTASLLTTFQTLPGRYKFERLPFGLSVSSEIFQRKAHEALSDLVGVHIIADNVVISGAGSNLIEARKSHDQRLETFLQRCRDTGTVLNKAKFNLRESEIALMGHVVGVNGVKPDPEKVKAILDMPNPTDLPKPPCKIFTTPDISSEATPIAHLSGGSLALGVLA